MSDWKPRKGPARLAPSTARESRYERMQRLAKASAQLTPAQARWVFAEQARVLSGELMRSGVRLLEQGHNKQGSSVLASAITLSVIKGALSRAPDDQQG